MTTHQFDARHDPVAALEGSTRGLSAWWAAIPTLLALLVWPLHTLITALLLATVLVIAGVYTIWMEHHPVPPVRRHRRDATVRRSLVAVVGVGTLLVIAFPIPMATATFAVALVASVAWIALDYSVRHAGARTAAAEA